MGAEITQLIGRWVKGWMKEFVESIPDCVAKVAVKDIVFDSDGDGLLEGRQLSVPSFVLSFLGGMVLGLGVVIIGVACVSIIEVVNKSLGFPMLPIWMRWSIFR